MPHLNEWVVELDQCLQLLPQRTVWNKQDEQVILKQGGEAGGVHHDLLHALGPGLLQTRDPGHLDSHVFILKILHETLPDVPLSPTHLLEVCKALDLRLRPRECRLEPFHPRLCVMEIRFLVDTDFTLAYLSPTVNRAEVSRRRCIMLLWPGPGCWHLWHLRGQ